jgi:RND family efflux transporter MFP subunit
MSRRLAARAAAPFVLPLAAAALLSTAACGGGGPAQPPRGQGFPPVSVQLVAATETPIEDASVYVATLKSLRSTTIQPQIDGQIVRIDVKSGDRVRPGQPLVQIDARRQQAVVSTQEAQRKATEANVEYARQQATRAQALYTAGAISKQELEQAQTALQTAEATLQALQAQVLQQEEQLRYYTVTAPTAGVVGDIPVRVGMQVSSQTLLTTVDQNDPLEVYVSVPVERSSDLKRGLPLQVLSGDGSQTLAATTIGFISPRVEGTTQTILVTGRVSNPEEALRSSQFVRARIVWRTSPGLVVPVTSVLRINGQFFAFVADRADGKLVARQRAITVGDIVGNNYVVLTGLMPGDQVVVSGVQRLVDGAPIAPQESAPSSKP